MLTWSVEEVLKACNDASVLFKDICRRLNIQYNDWGYFTSEELIDLLMGRKSITSLNISERKKGYMYLIENAQATAIYGEKAAVLADT
jgi:hypothetical protein